MITTGFIAAAGLLFLVMKLGVRKVINYDLFFDVLITGALMFALAGTFSGMMTALVGGAIVSVVLFTMKRTMNHESLAVVNEPVTVLTKPVPIPKLKWITLTPSGERIK